MDDLYDKNKFLGEYTFAHYAIHRSYLPGSGNIHAMAYRQDRSCDCTTPGSLRWPAPWSLPSPSCTASASTPASSST